MKCKGIPGHDHMVVLPHGEVYSIQHCDKVCQWLAAVQWFSPGTSVSSTNKTDRHDIIKILLKVRLNTLTLTLDQSKTKLYDWHDITEILLKVRLNTITLTLTLDQSKTKLFLQILIVCYLLLGLYLCQI